MLARVPRFAFVVLTSLLPGLAACHDHPVPDDASPPTLACANDAGRPEFRCSFASYCVDSFYLATTPAPATCGTDGYCHWQDPTSLTECPCGCNVQAGRCGHCGSTAY